MLFKDWVIYDDDRFCVVNKPAGLPVQPDKTGDISLLEIAGKYYRSDLYPIHRIDRPVSGLILLGRESRSTAVLSELFRERKIDKIYLALVENKLPELTGTLRHHLDTSPLSLNKTIVHSDPHNESNLAITHYKILGMTDRYCLVSLHPVTGKHHQLRAQLGAAGCPVKGDVKYGARRGNRDRSINLHSWRIQFNYPGMAAAEFYEAPLPMDILWQACKEFIP